MTTKQVFTFKEGKYSIDTLRSHLRNSPKICIKSTDLDRDFQTAVQLPESFDDSRELITLYQYGGKYFVLLGMKKILPLLEHRKDVNISGYLVTKHTLKKTEVVERQPEPVVQRVNEYISTPRDNRSDRGENIQYRRNYQRHTGQRGYRLVNPE